MVVRYEENINWDLFTMKLKHLKDKCSHLEGVTWKYKWGWLCCSHNNPHDQMQMKNKPIYILLLGLCCGTAHLISPPRHIEEV